jgi:hypothetical protein
MKEAIVSAFSCLVLGVWVPAQNEVRQLKGSGHLLGETVEQFYSEGKVGEVFRACQAGDWKTVNQLLKNETHVSKSSAKDTCAAQAIAKQNATSGTRLEYKGSGDTETMRSDTFTFEGGHLVKIDLVYNTPIAHIEGYHPKSFTELYEGLQEAYGLPTKTYTESVFSVYGVKYEGHRAIWLGKENVITILEQPGENGWTEIIVATLAEHNRAEKAPKAANPLQ